MALQGYDLYALDAVEGDKLKELKGEKCTTFQVDVTSPESIEKFKKSIGDQPVDLLLNIAGQLTYHCLHMNEFQGKVNMYQASCQIQKRTPEKR